MQQFFLEVPETHRNISRLLGRCCHTSAECWEPNNQAKLSKYMGSGRSISQLLLGHHAANTFCRFLKHIGTFPDYLGGVDTPVGRVPVPQNQAKL